MSEKGPYSTPGEGAVRFYERPSVRSAVGYGIVVLFFALCGQYIVRHRHEFSFVAGLSRTDLAWASFFVVAGFLLSAHQLRLFLANFDLDLGALEVCCLTTAMCLGNFVTPMRGGSGGLAIYLRKVHRLDFQSFAVIYGGTSLLIALINSGIALIGLFILYVDHGFFHAGLSALVGLMFGVFFYFSVFPPPVRWQGSGLLGIAFNIGRSWRLLARKRRLLLGLTISFTLVALSLTAAFYFIFRSIGAPLPFSGALVVSGLGHTANLVPLTPGALGVFDAVTIEIPKILGLDAAHSIASTLVFRAVSFVWLLLLGVPGLIYALRRSREQDRAEPRPVKPAVADNNSDT